MINTENNIPEENFINDSQIKYKTVFLNIDSSFRRKTTTFEIEDNFFLGKNPLNFKKNTNDLLIKHNNHGFHIGENISLTNVIGKQVILRTFDNNNNPIFIIQPGCNIMKIFYKHNLPKKYSGNNLEIEITGIKGDTGYNSNSSYLGNIPVNLINTVHSIKLEINKEEFEQNFENNYFDQNFYKYDPNYFFIILSKTMQKKQNPYKLKEYNFKLNFMHIAGIPINLLNTGFPSNKDHLNGYHIIKNIDNDYYTIELSMDALYDDTSGGSSIVSGKILSINYGYPESNQYAIDLEKTYNNISSVRMISSEFPNINNLIKDFPIEQANNKLYWNNNEDGNILYEITVPNGTYTEDKLAKILEKLFFKTKKIDPENNYLPNHIVKISINKQTNEVIFKKFKEAILNCPFQKTIPEINDFINPNNLEEKINYELIINHPDHGLIENYIKIRIQGSTSHLGIPDNIINDEHVISEIINENEYKIKLKNFNFLEEKIKTFGGSNVSIQVPAKFRLRFDKPGTLGSILGFRKINEQYSITPFSHIISNKHNYDKDYDSNFINTLIFPKKNNYIFLILNPLNNITSCGTVKNAFAKIQLLETCDKTIYNSFVPTAKYFDDPIKEISRLEIELRTSDGYLFDTFGLDHSFTLELVILIDNI
ncbi:Hypothetical protein KVN_LOCUS454 [uncultured virus]|nr:Hypothetical protein KVN_LOCUS454 [uncultured virus]